MALGLSTTTFTAGISFRAFVTGMISGTTVSATSSDNTPLTTYPIFKRFDPSSKGYAVEGLYSAASSPTVTLTDSLGNTSNVALTIAGATSPSLSGTPGSATVGQSYRFSPTLSGGSGAGRFSATNLPSGLAVNVNSGDIFGKPVTAGSYTGITLTYTDQNGSSVTLSGLSITVSGSGAGPVYPTITAITPLPTLSVAYHRVYSPFKVIGNYTGPTMKLRNNSGGALTDVTPDQTTGIPAAQPSSTINTLYEQMGSGVPATQATLANQPIYDPTAAEGGITPVLFGYYPSKQPKFLNINTTTLDRSNVGYYAVASIRQAAFLDVFATFFPPSGTTDLLALYTASNAGLTSAASGLAARNTGFFLRDRRMSVAYANDTTSERIYADGVKSTGTARSALALNTGARLGSDNTGGSGSNHTSFVEIILAGAPTDADIAALDAWASTNFKYNTVTPTKRVVYSGSSLISGEGRSLGRNPAYWPLVSTDMSETADDVEIIDMGVPGRNLATEYSSRSTLDFAVFKAGIRNVLVIDAASNDINAATYPDAPTATSQAQSFYTNTIVPFVNAARAAGFYNIVVPTIIGRTGFDTTTNFRLTALLALNAAIVNGAAANRHLVSDRYGDTRLQDPSNTTYFFTDNIHLNDVGGAVLDAIDHAALVTAMNGPQL